ncbi:choice-of-anchor D domain-containing protein, partial [Streptomyces sp. NPDC005921]
ERTRREARSAARVVHPNVVVVHDVVEDDGRPCIVMEYVPATTLADVLDGGRTLPPEEAARIGLGMIAALRAAHAAGVLHRDVKPGNVLLGPGDRVVLTDFGIALTAGSSTLTQTGQMVGSIPYMAPERLRGLTPGPASDLWSLGATLYQAVEGRPPFRRDTAMETAYAIVTDPVEPMRHAGPLEPLVQLLLAKDPADRPSAEQTERALLATWSGAVTEAPTVAPQPHGPESAQLPVSAWGALTNTPGSNPHHFYDEAHRLFATSYPAGTTFKLQVDSGDNASSYTIDFADFEQVGAALTAPSGAVSVTGKGADATGATDATGAFNAAISAAGPGGTVWIPPGTYNIPGHISVNNVTIAGAGMWYSTVTGTAPGFYGNSAPSASTGVHLQNFAIFGDVRERNDSAQVNGIGGAMSNSTVSSVWIDHMKVGAWMDGPMDGLTFSGVRIRDTTADGINFHGAVTDSKVTNSDIRNTGDDGIATWADSGIGADANDTISDNTVSLQILANGIAIYGGHDNTVSGNRVVDSGITQGGGIHVGQRFSSTPVGTTTISGNTLVRDGSLDPNWQFGVGALWFDGSQGAITGPVNVTNALIQQSPYEAVQWVEGTISGVNLTDVTIAGTGTFALQEQTGGAAKFTNVKATGVGYSSPVYSCSAGSFTVTDGGGNSGIGGTPYCGGWPAPVYPPYPSEGVTATPGALNFGSIPTGSTSDAQTVTVSNPTGGAASVSSVSTSGDYSQTNTCGSSIPANGSCTVGVKFTPTATGGRSGTLTVTAGGITDTVALSGTGTAPGPVLSTDPASLSFAATVVGSSATAQTVKVTNSGTTSATVSGVSATGDFSQTNNCATLAVGASCTVTVGFKPTTGGPRTGNLTVTSAVSSVSGSRAPAGRCATLPH